jgi:hypothetical protein
MSIRNVEEAAPFPRMPSPSPPSPPPTQEVAKRTVHPAEPIFNSLGKRSVADPGCFIPDPSICSSRISDPGSRI